MGVKIGNKNKIKNSTIIGGSQINMSSQNTPTEKESFWRSVWQSLVSNLIWWIIITVLIITVGIATSMNWDSIMEFILNR